MLKTADGSVNVRKGQRFSGFKVIGMDPETDTVLLQMGQGGEVLRIWPEPSVEEL